MSVYYTELSRGRVTDLFSLLKMASLYAPGIVVLNKKYFPKDLFSGPAQVGATSFALSVLQTLHNERIPCGIVLYQRDETLKETYYETESSTYNGVSITVATVAFNFYMPQSSITSALKEVYTQVHRQTRSALPPIVYYQTDTLLHYHPANIPFCVTHHGPFVSDFTNAFTPSLAQLAFGGDQNKIRILEEQQRLGVDRLLRDELGTVLAHSSLQERYLRFQGLDQTRFKQLRPPIGTPQCNSSHHLLPASIEQFVSAADLLLFTAVARLDYFKNVEILIQVGMELLRQSVPVKVLIVGDPDNDATRRRLLLDLVPNEQQQHFLVLPRLPKDDLYALFSAVRYNGIFICSSRFETLGITPLEAAASGVTTLITDSEKVEASRYLPPCSRVRSNMLDVVSKVLLIHQDGVSKWAEMVQTHVSRDTSLEAFRDDLVEAWKSMSISVNQTFIRQQPRASMKRYSFAKPVVIIPSKVVEANRTSSVHLHASVTVTEIDPSSEED